MKFGKQILSQQISGWGAFYLDYKLLKKIINSLEKGRLGDAALLATGQRPDFPSGTPSTSSSAAAEPIIVPGPSPGILPPEAGTGSGTVPGKESGAKEEELRLHRAAFFFRLERELEKINAFYLGKQAELQSRLRTLIEKRKLVQSSSAKLSRDSPSFVALYESFKWLEKDLNKLQQFIEINATGFRKILKKWDKRSKSNTKELYLARQVDVQPCFNRQFMAEMNDIVAANLLDLENFSEGRLTTSEGSDGVNDGTDINPNRPLDFASARSEVDALADVEENLMTAIISGRDSEARELIRVAERAQEGKEKTNVARIVWRALARAPSDAVKLALDSAIPDFGFVDDINSRTCLHEAAIAGNLQLVQACVQFGVDVRLQDAYGRAALSYAAMGGHSDVVRLLLSIPSVDPNVVDLDGFTPLVLTITNGYVEIARLLIEHGVSVGPAQNTDLVPLSLACQGGHTDIVRLLLGRNANIIANSEGLFSQHLAARAGHADICRLIIAAGGDPNVVEKGTLWTPIFFAAESGHVECVQALVECAARIDLLDEKGRSPAFHAAWNGKITCLLILLEAATHLSAVGNKAQDVDRMLTDGASPSSTSSSPLKIRQLGSAEMESQPISADLEDLEMDAIPSLSLPPPIIPFRHYGHNYLSSTRHLVSIALARSPVRLYSSERQDQRYSSLKLVMTSKNVTAIPHGIVLPLADEHEVFSFQIDNLDSSPLELELLPTFGSKLIGKAVALPSLFDDIMSSKHLTLPLIDSHMKVIGDVTFDLELVKPFDSVQLEIGGKVETYWKSTLPSVAFPTNSQRMTASGGGSMPAVTTTTTTTMSPASHAASTPTVGSLGGTHLASSTSSFVTASSLSGEYVRVIIQVTRDGHAVVYPDWTLSTEISDVFVGSVTRNQFVAMAERLDKTLKVDKPFEQLTAQDLSKAIETSMITLEALLELLPVHVCLDFDLRYPTNSDVRRHPGLPKGELNAFVDSVLHQVYAAGTQNRQSRKIIFSSFNPTVCTALNWKQPNYAVFFASYCGLSRSASAEGRMVPANREESDFRCLSVHEAVKFAKSNNLLGVMVNATLLAQVPPLITAIKEAGLILATIGSRSQAEGGVDDGVDAVLFGGVLHTRENVDSF